MLSPDARLFLCRMADVAWRCLDRKMAAADRAVRDARTTESGLLRLEDPKRQRMVEKSSLRDEAKMHPPQASEKTREFDPAEVTFKCNIK